MKKKLMIIGIIFLLIAAYALFIEGKMLKIYTYELNKTEKNQPSFKVIQLSDILLSLPVIWLIISQALIS